MQAGLGNHNILDRVAMFLSEYALVDTRISEAHACLVKTAATGKGDSISVGLVLSPLLAITQLLRTSHKSTEGAGVRVL
jgi:hypothetical protein